MNESRRRIFFTVFIFTCLGFMGGYVLAQSPLAPYRVAGPPLSGEAQVVFEPFWEVWELVQTRYYEQPVDNQALVEGAIVGMLAALDDDHTRYLSPADQEAAERSFSGEYQGIGAEVEARDGRITIVSPFDGSPAQVAGLRPGDIIVAADGVILDGMDVSEAAALVRGPAGTAVRLQIERDGETFDVEIIRDTVKLVSATGRMLPENIAYLRLSRFGDMTGDELNALLPGLMTQNPVGLILDLRRNPGGALDTTVKIADEFLAEGTVLVERFGDGRERVFSSKDGNLAETIPLVVLIDEGSASASEVLAGAIQDTGRGILIGQTSFGKGTVQTWHTLSNSGGVRITIAQWLTPGETSIDKLGLTPDYFIPLSEDAIIADEGDTQLQAAIDFLTGQTIISIPPEDTGVGEGGSEQ
ncbi:MAG: S41 family peptidase [Anaerolineae bacterium]|nr:S41 family peptidase [Anaerolineae bacterium]